jgi:hypothetical protein
MNRSKIGQGKVSLDTFFSTKESIPGRGAERPPHCKTGKSAPNINPFPDKKSKHSRYETLDPFGLKIASVGHAE